MMKFPQDFLFGVGSSAYQIEGAANEGGKGQSTLDYFLHNRPEAVIDGSNGDVACNSYNLYKQDAALMKDLGVNFYRFSINWCRILPTGDITKVNQEGIDHYNDVINNLLENGIQPMVTMFHWDLPQALQDMGGWLNPLIANYFEDYAYLLFTHFGDRVKWWCTINEPRLYASFAYGRPLPVYPLLGPGLELPGIGDYIALHHQLIAHAKAYQLYDKHFRADQKGQIGIVVDAFFYNPATESKADVEAAKRALTIELGCVLHPIYSQEGDYPPVLRERVDRNSRLEGRHRSRLPKFTSEEIESLKGSSDFVGLNHYTTHLVVNGASGPIPSMLRDIEIIKSVDPNTNERHPAWLTPNPEGFRSILGWIKDNYGNPTVIITENGCSDIRPSEDTYKVEYHRSYLEQLLKAIHLDKCNVKGYTAWSLLDSYEWDCGYTERFGLYHVDFTNPARPRTPKKSAEFYKKLIQDRCLPSID